MNTISITGRLCGEPELKTTPSGVTVVNAQVAVKRPFVKDATDFFTVLFWRQQAEYIGKFAHKGDLIGVTGFMATREYDAKDGTHKVNWELTANAAEILTPKGATNNSPAPTSAPAPAQAQPQQAAMTPLGDDDLPF